MFRRLSIVIILALTLLARGQVAAAPVDDLLKLGIQSFDLARFEEARKALLQARVATKDPRKLARVYLYFGFIEAVSGSQATARTWLVKALEQDPTLTLSGGPFKKELVALFKEVRGALRGAVLVHARQPPHAVYIDGKPAGRLPLLTNLPIGKHDVQVRGPDGKPVYSTTVVVEPHKTGRVAVTAPSSQPTASLSDLVPAKTRPRRRVLTWIAAGSAAALLGTAIGVGVSTHNTSNQWEENCQENVLVSNCEDLALSVEHRDLAANVMFAVGGSLAAAAVLLYFFEDHPGKESRRKRRPRARPQVAPVVGGGMVGGMLTIGF